MTKLNEKQIEKLEAKGFKRWTKGSYDRLYINPEDYGVEYDYYKTGNISSVKLNGERVSNADGRRLKASKVYIDVETGELHVKTDSCWGDEIREAVEAIMDECLADEADDNSGSLPVEEHFGYKAEHTTENLVEDVDNLLFISTDFETEYDERCAEHLRGWLYREMTELDYENGNRYWLPFDDVPEVEEALDKAFQDPDAPEGIEDWYWSH